MKKKLLLLASILLPLVSGCGYNPTTEPTIEPNLKDNYDEFITHKYDELLNNVWHPDEFEPVLSEWDTIGLKVFEEYNVSIYSFENGISKNVFLCGYVDSEIVDELESVTRFFPPDFMYDQFIGVNDLYAKYCQLLDKKEKENTPIIWYEFNKNTDIPETIGNKKIIMKSNIYEIPVNNLNGEYISSFDYLVEGELNIRVDQLSYSINGKWHTKMSYMDYRHSSIRDDYVTTNLINGEKYAAISSYRLSLNGQLFGKNILEEVEYVQKNGQYNFNLSDLSKFIEENKK